MMDKICSLCAGTGRIYKSTLDPLDLVQELPCPRCLDKVMRDLISDSSPQVRPEWDDIWMDLAVMVGSRSTCNTPNRQVGCVVVSEDNTKVLALGYNGGAKGDSNECDYCESPKIGTSRCTCVHAEMNCLTKLDTSNPCYKKMYLTLSPCSLCYKLVVNAGINELIYRDLYEEGILDKLSGLGVKVRKI